MRRVCFTVDAEPDCPPYLRGWRGMEEGLPLLLDVLDEEDVTATVFLTGEAAERYPRLTAEVVARGHELGCHGMTHRPFPSMAREEARDEVVRASAILRRHAPVSSFRAPYLRFPDRFLPLLEENGYRVDSSRGRYKPAHWRPSGPTSLRRIPASITSSWLRLPDALRTPMLLRLRNPVVLFVHPWELVDLRAAPIPWSCRAGTGPRALERIRSALRLLREEGAHFATLADEGKGAHGSVAEA